jgi:hypothetical protein
MTLLRRFGLTVLIFGLTVTAAHATPVTVNAGETLTFNFDFVTAGVSPAPRYDSMRFDTHRTSPADDGSWTFLSEFDGTGTSLGFSDPITLGARVISDIGWTDGVFSVVLSVTAGSVTVDPTAFGTLNDIQTPTVFPNQTPVPEPATLTMLGLGLAGMGARRWRRRSP